MKICPHCAEEIQDDAKVCKHCGRKVTRKNARTYVTTGILIVLLLWVARALLVSYNSSHGDPLGKAMGGRQAPPYVITLGNEQPLEILPRQYEHWDFSIPARTCVLSAHVEGVSGGNKDFIGYVLKDDDFKNWVTNHPASGEESQLVAAWSPSMTLVGPGKYHLVVSNTFSVVATKVITMTGTVTCQL